MSYTLAIYCGSDSTHHHHHTPCTLTLFRSFPLRNLNRDICFAVQTNSSVMFLLVPSFSVTPFLFNSHLVFWNSLLTSEFIGVLWKVFGKPPTEYFRHRSTDQLERVTYLTKSLWQTYITFCCAFSVAHLSVLYMRGKLGVNQRKTKKLLFRFREEILFVSLGQYKRMVKEEEDVPAKYINYMW